jgi:hypothetical protein
MNIKDSCLVTNFFEIFASRLPTESVLRASVGYDGDSLRKLLSQRTPEQLSVQDIRSEIEGNLWIFSSETFLHFLRSFLHLSLKSYRSISIFVSELVSALTEPCRTDVVEALDRFTQMPPNFGLPDKTSALMRQQQVEWFDSGTPLAIFHERFDTLTQIEGAAIYSFLLFKPLTEKTFRLESSRLLSIDIGLAIKPKL